MKKSKLLDFLSDNNISRQAKSKVLDELVEEFFEKGWKGNEHTQKIIHSFVAKKMKEDFDRWYDKNINLFPLKQLGEIQKIFYDWIPITNPSKYCDSEKYNEKAHRIEEKE